MIILENIAVITRGFIGSILYLVSAWCLGRSLMKLLGIELQSLSTVISCLVGASLFSFAFTVLSLTDRAYPWLICALGVIPFVFCFREIYNYKIAARMRNLMLLRNEKTVLLIATICTVYLIYTLTLCLGNYYGCDLAVYHLSIPRDILANHGFYFNRFFLAAGLPLGWHHFGLAAFAIGGERGYLAMSFWAFLGAMIFAYVILKKGKEKFSSIRGMMGALTAGYIIVGMVRGSIPNNDVPLMLVNVAALMLALKENGLKWFQRSILAGLLTGFALSIKTQSLFFVPILSLALLISAPPKKRIVTFLLYSLA